jgi:hypothetical protein
MTVGLLAITIRSAPDAVAASHTLNASWVLTL